MRKLVFIVPGYCDGKNVGYFLRKCCGISYRLLCRLKREPLGITVNEEHARTVDLVRAGDVVELRMPADERPAQAAGMPVDVLYEDEDLILLDKPPAMPVHPSRRHVGDTLANAFASLMEERGLCLAFRPVNRLDKDTSGIVVAAKNPFAAAGLAGKIGKTYLAVCEGELEGRGTIELPIALKPGHGIMREIREDGDMAVTHYAVLGRAMGHSVLKVWIETGRTHQIRVHFSAIGHPLAGDEMYGGSTAMIDRQALHCEYVAFTHPVTKERVEVKSGLPKDIRELFTKLSFVYK